MKKILKISLFIIFSLIVAGLVDLTLILQFLLITYSATVVLYFLSGLFIKKKAFGVFSILFLIPLIFLNIFALVVNKETFPVFSPLTLILAVFSFLLGQAIADGNTKNKLRYYLLLALTLFLFLSCLFFAPYYMYNKNIEKITSKSSVYDSLRFFNLNETPFDINSLKGKTVLIENWFLDCYQCILKLPSLQSLSEKAISDSSIKIITVINGKIDSLKKVKDYVSKHPEITIPILYDPENSIKTLFEIDGYPIEFIIDKNGFIKERHDGFNKDERIIYVSETLKKLKRYNEE